MSFESASVLAEKLANGRTFRGIWEELSIGPPVTGNFMHSTTTSGALGALPLSRFKNGDIAAARIAAGKPPEEWAIWRLSGSDLSAEPLAGGLKTWIASHILHCVSAGDIPAIEMIIERRESLCKLAIFLGDEKGHTEAVIDELIKGRPDRSRDKYSLFTMTEGGESIWTKFYRTYREVMVEGKDPVKSWHLLHSKNPGFEPALLMLWGALRTFATGKSLDTAWRVSILPRMWAGGRVFSDAMRTGPAGGFKISDDSAKLLFDEDPFAMAAVFTACHGSGVYGGHPFWKAVKAIADEEGITDAWIEAAERCCSEGRFRKAWAAWQNAVFYSLCETKAVDDSLFKALSKFALKMKDINITYALQSLSRQQ